MAMMAVNTIGRRVAGSGAPLANLLVAIARNTALSNLDFVHAALGREPDCMIGATRLPQARTSHRKI